MRKRDTRGKLIPFSITVCKMNFATGEGGGRLHARRAVFYEKKHVKKESSGSKKNPHHEDNGTRNIQILPSNEIRTIHVRLIEKFNGKIVFD